MGVGVGAPTGVTPNGGAVGVGAGAGAGVGVGTDEPVGVAPGARDCVGVDRGRAGAVGQLARAGLNGTGVGVVATGAADGLAPAVVPGLAAGRGVALGAAVGTALGVVTYGVKEGQVGSGGMGGVCAPSMTSEMATTTAPMITVSTKVIAPHSRRKRFRFMR